MYFCLINVEVTPLLPLPEEIYQALVFFFSQDISLLHLTHRFRNIFVIGPLQVMYRLENQTHQCSVSYLRNHKGAGSIASEIMI